MGEIVGYVLPGRGRPGATSGSLTSGLSALQLHDYEAVGPQFRHIDTYGTLSAAQAAVAALQGGTMLNWQRETTEQDVERYVGRALDFYPGDYKRANLTGAFLRADSGILSGGTPAPDDVQRWTSANDSRGLTQANTSTPTAPLLIPVALGGYPALRFDVALDVAMSLTFTDAAGVSLGGAPSLGAPALIMGVGVWEDAGREQIMIQNDRGLFVRVTAGGVWEVETGGMTIVGPAATPGAGAIITVSESATVTEAFLNGESFGSVAAVTAAGRWTISDPAGSSWFRDISEVTITDFFQQPIRRQTLETYALQRYLPHLT